MAAPDDQWEVTGDVPEHVKAFVASEVNAHFPGPVELHSSLLMWGQYPPPHTKPQGEN